MGFLLSYDTTTSYSCMSYEYIHNNTLRVSVCLVRAARGSTVPENNNNLCVYTAKLVLIYVAWHDGVRGREWRGIFPAPSLLVHNKRRLSSSLALSFNKIYKQGGF